MGAPALIVVDLNAGRLTDYGWRLCDVVMQQEDGDDAARSERALALALRARNVGTGYLALEAGVEMRW